ncbi:hypothetical protein ACE6H2_027260 [Prunus campanulata]
MHGSKVEQLWNKEQNLENLKVIDLSFSTHLIKVPDLSQSRKLVHINHFGCTSLVQIPSYLQCLDKLTHLDMGECSNLKYLQQMPSNIEFLNLSKTAIRELPSSVWSHEKISYLDIRFCNDLRNLPSSSCKLKLPSSSFSLEGCSCLGKFSELPRDLTVLAMIRAKIEVLPSSIEYLFGLNTIRLLDCKRFVSLPSTICNYPHQLNFISLVKIELTNCKKFVCLPTSICKLKCLSDLDLTGCSKFEDFPEIFEPMGELKILSLEGTSVKVLPSSIECLFGLSKIDMKNSKRLFIYNLNRLITLRFDGCLKLKKLPPFSVGLHSLEVLNLSYCSTLQIPDHLLCLTSLRDLKLSGTMIESIPASIKQASWLFCLSLINCKSLQSLPELPLMLYSLKAHGCTLLNTVSSPRTALTQGLDGYNLFPGLNQELIFCNCLKLDQDTWNHIMADAQLRIMRLAFASSKFDKFENYYTRRPSVTIVCPGHEIPNWFSYQNEGSSINIKLPPDWFYSNFLGFALSLVVGFDNYNVKGSLGFGCKFNFKANNESNDYNFNSDHVVVWYSAFELVGLLFNGS